MKQRFGRMSVRGLGRRCTRRKRYVSSSLDALYALHFSVTDVRQYHRRKSAHVRSSARLHTDATRRQSSDPNPVKQATPTSLHWLPAKVIPPTHHVQGLPNPTRRVLTLPALARLAQGLGVSWRGASKLGNELAQDESRISPSIHPIPSHPLPSHPSAIDPSHLSTLSIPPIPSPQ